MDVLVYVEASIYQADEENELLAKAGHGSQDHTHAGKLHAGFCLGLLSFLCPHCCRRAGEQVMEDVLRGAGLLSEAVQLQLTQVWLPNPVSGPA